MFDLISLIDEKIKPATCDSTIRFLENDFAFGYFLTKKSKCVFNYVISIFATYGTLNSNPNK